MCVCMCMCIYIYIYMYIYIYVCSLFQGPCTHLLLSPKKTSMTDTNFANSVQRLSSGKAIYGLYSKKKNVYSLCLHLFSGTVHRRINIRPLPPSPPHPLPPPLPRGRGASPSLSLGVKAGRGEGVGWGEGEGAYVYTSVYVSAK